MADTQPRALSILVAEDDDDTRQLICRVLEGGGYDVTPARSGTEALSLAREVRPDALVIDLAMPGIDGLELTRAVRSEDGLESVPILLVSAEVRGREVAKVFGAGITSYVPKPFRPRGLLDALAEVFD